MHGLVDDDLSILFCWTIKLINFSCDPSYHHWSVLSDRRRREVLALEVHSTKRFVSLYCLSHCTVYTTKILNTHSRRTATSWKLFDRESNGVWIRHDRLKEKASYYIIYSTTTSACHIILFISHLDLFSLYAPAIAIATFFF